MSFKKYKQEQQENLLVSWITVTCNGVLNTVGRFGHKKWAYIFLTISSVSDIKRRNNSTQKVTTHYFTILCFTNRYIF